MTLASVRSALFVPGNDHRKLSNALSSRADLVIADLEDSVPARERDAAREAIIRSFRSPRLVPLVAIRISDDVEADVSACAEAGVDAIVVPKASPGRVASLEARWPVVAIIETAEALLSVREVSAMAPVSRLLLGSVDLAAQLGLEPRADGAELLFARSQLVLASAAEGKAAPIDGVFRNVRDIEGLANDVALARSLGFTGKACIHPAQLEVVNQGFSPGPAELDWARRVVREYEDAVLAGRGAIAIEGTMVDVPVVERARRILERSAALDDPG